MSRQLKRGAIVSLAAHALVSAALLLGVSLSKPDEMPPEMEVELAFAPGQYMYVPTGS